MPIRWARLIVQHLSFLVMTFGGRAGVFLGNTVPCLACPFVAGCGGSCYLRLLQGPLGGLGMGWSQLLSARGLTALMAFALFAAMVALLGSAWCGWACPFGLVQDWAARLRNRLGIRESVPSDGALAALRALKWALLVYLVATPALIRAGIVHPDMAAPFCAVCPAKILMPLLTGNPEHLKIDLTNGVLLATSSLLVIVTGVTLVGMFFRTRFFCLICPMSALIGLLAFLHLPRLVKRPSACLDCGNCRRVCPTRLDKRVPAKAAGAAAFASVPAAPARAAARPEEIRADLIGCQGCLNCVQCCSTDGAMAVKVGPWTVLESSRARAARVAAKAAAGMRRLAPAAARRDGSGPGDGRKIAAKIWTRIGEGKIGPGKIGGGIGLGAARDAGKEGADGV